MTYPSFPASRIPANNPVQGADTVPLTIVGNKYDLRPEQRQVTLADGKKLAEELGCGFTEASARYNENVGKAFEGMIAEIEKGQADSTYSLKMHKAPVTVSRTKGPRYTPVSKRQDKPDGINWIIRNHPEVSDGQISKLIGTTRTTIAAIRDRSHWNMANITPKDPVTLGLTTQRELDAAIAKAQKAAGMEERVDTRLDGDREALISELRAEREQHARDAEAALAAADGTDTSDEIVPGIKDPFKH